MWAMQAKIAVGTICVLLWFLVCQSEEGEMTMPSGGKSWIVPGLGMQFVWIEQLNCWVGKYEVTNAEYRKFNQDHSSGKFETHTLNDDRQPVVYVNFDDATKYAEWLTEREHHAGRLPSRYRYRLPTREEWTTFCQCGDNRKYPWGNEWAPRYGNYHGHEGARSSSKKMVIKGYDDGFPVTCSVEMSGENDWRLYGVGGNVWELTVKSSSDLSFDAWRGGSWANYEADGLQSTFRLAINPLRRNNGGGFRLVLAPSEESGQTRKMSRSE